MQLEVYEEPTGLVCGIRRLKGRIDLPRREWLAAVREEIARIEGIAKRAGCAELRLGGRDWSRPLKGMGYVPFPAIENGLRKRL